MKKELLDLVRPILREALKPDTSGIPYDIKCFREIYRLATTRMDHNEALDRIAELSKPFAVD
jgi:hypothetical protein